MVVAQRETGVASDTSVIGVPQIYSNTSVSHDMSVSHLVDVSHTTRDTRDAAGEMEASAASCGSLGWAQSDPSSAYSESLESSLQLESQSGVAIHELLVPYFIIHLNQSHDGGDGGHNDGGGTKATTASPFVTPPPTRSPTPSPTPVSKHQSQLIRSISMRHIITHSHRITNHFTLSNRINASDHPVYQNVVLSALGINRNDSHLQAPPTWDFRYMDDSSYQLHSYIVLPIHHAQVYRHDPFGDYRRCSAFAVSGVDRNDVKCPHSTYDEIDHVMPTTSNPITQVDTASHTGIPHSPTTSPQTILAMIQSREPVTYSWWEFHDMRVSIPFTDIVTDTINHRVLHTVKTDAIHGGRRHRPVSVSFGLDSGVRTSGDLSRQQRRRSDLTPMRSKDPMPTPPVSHPATPTPSAPHPINFTVAVMRGADTPILSTPTMRMQRRAWHTIMNATRWCKQISGVGGGNITTDPYGPLLRPPPPSSPSLPSVSVSTSTNDTVPVPSTTNTHHHSIHQPITTRESSPNSFEQCHFSGVAHVRVWLRRSWTLHYTDSH